MELLIHKTHDKIEQLQKENEDLREGLEEAITGLEWWMEGYPAGIGKEDDHKIETFKSLLNK